MLSKVSITRHHFQYSLHQHSLLIKESIAIEINEIFQSNLEFQFSDKDLFLPQYSRLRGACTWKIKIKIDFFFRFK